MFPPGNTLFPPGNGVSVSDCCDRRSHKETSVALYTTLQGMECHHSSCAEHIRVCLCFCCGICCSCCCRRDEVQWSDAELKTWRRSTRTGALTSCRKRRS